MRRPARCDSASCCRAPLPAMTWRTGETPMPDAVDLIRAKRDGGRLAEGDIRWLINAYTAGTVADEQMSALLMAIYFNGLDRPELEAWTAAMISSGERL